VGAIGLKLRCIQILFIGAVAISFYSNEILLFNLVSIIDLIYSSSSSLFTKLFIMVYFLIDFWQVFIKADMLLELLLELSMLMLFLNADEDEGSCN
jgi:hypothetical protein